MERTTTRTEVITTEKMGEATETRTTTTTETVTER